MSTSSPSLILFTTSQTPLPVRYPHPRKPQLVLPPLVHRSLHNALDGEGPSVLNDEATLVIPHPDGLVKNDLPSHSHSLSEKTGVDQINQSSPQDGMIAQLPESASIHTPLDIELTVKLHLVSSPSSQSSSPPSGNDSASSLLQMISESLETLSRYKGLSSTAIDTLLIGFKGMDYRGSKTIASEMFGCGSEGLEAPNTETVSPELEKQILGLWKELSNDDDDDQGVIGRDVKLGILYSPLGLLRKLVEQQEGSGTGRKVGVNALDTPDCHHLPKEYTQYAREHGVELWAGGGGEGSDPLPSAHLHNLLQEFVPALKTVGRPPKSVDRLERLIPVRADGLKFETEQVEKGLEVRWVLSYTLVSKTRNVVKDKGYIIAADLAS
ncbi:hypothetical protein IAR55_000750 [Kwoniella newhampshirensis]|uniref:GCS light chain n=1 Tax=Kwoniella newhampshirensis TaxID=1651941 RepID=A0AAW0Z3T6_9TREE